MPVVFHIARVNRTQTLACAHTMANKNNNNDDDVDDDEKKATKKVIKVFKKWKQPHQQRNNRNGEKVKPILRAPSIGVSLEKLHKTSTQLVNVRVLQQNRIVAPNQTGR